MANKLENEGRKKKEDMRKEEGKEGERRPIYLAVGSLAQFSFPASHLFSYAE